MNRINNRYALAVLGLGVVTALAACGGGSTSGTSGTSGSGSDKVTLASNYDSASKGYDPQLYAQADFTFYSAMYDSLFVSDASGKVTPSLVASFSNSADKTKLTLKLRQGVTFTDGSKLDSTLVKQNLDQRSDSTLLIHGTLGPGAAQEITNVAAPDPDTVVITWAKPQANGQQALTDDVGTIVGSTAVANRDLLTTKPDGSGPYTLGSATHGSSYTFTRNDSQWDAKNYAYKTVVYKVINDPQALANALLSGQADVAGQLDPTTVDSVQSKQSIASVGGTVVGFPVFDKKGITNPAFAKQDVRLALNYATDRATLVSQLHPKDKATAQLFPSGATGFDPALNTKYNYDLAKAKKLLAQAGYPNGFSIDLTVKGQPTDDEVAIQQQWSQVGVKLNFITATSTDAFFAAGKTQPLGFNPFPVGTSNPAGFVAGVLYGGYANVQHATDPNIASALGSALAGTGAARATALTKLNDAITNDGWFIALYESYIYYGYDKSKVAAPALYASTGQPVLSSITPAG